MWGGPPTVGHVYDLMEKSIGEYQLEQRSVMFPVILRNIRSDIFSDAYAILSDHK